MRNHIDTRIIIAIIIIFPLLFIWQGLDFTDTGYYLTNYQQIFNDPESVKYSFAIWLTDVVGGCWIKIFGDSLGLLGINIAGVLVVYLTVGLSYLILKPYIDQKHLLIGLLLTLMFTKWVVPLYYNNLTSLFFVASSLFLINGLKKDKLWQVIISAFIMGLNIFIRLPNILGFLIILGIFFYGYINKTRVRILLTQSLAFILSYIFAILCVVMAMKILGHFDIFISNLKDFFDIASTTGSRYSVFRLLATYFKNYYQLIFRLCALMTLAYIFAFIISKFSTLFIKRHVHILFLIFILTAIMTSLYLNYIYSRVVLITTGILYLILIIYIFNIEKTDRDLRLISFIALIILVITPLGSNNGLRNSVYGMYLAMPIFYAYIFNMRKINVDILTESSNCLNQWKTRLNSEEIKLIRNILVVFFFTLSLVWSFIYTYLDSPNRIEMRYSVDHPRLRGIFTTKERAKVVQELLDVINKYVNEDDYVLAYNEIPMLHFLTKTRPYLYNCWPDASPSHQFRQMLDRAMREKAKFPIVVMAKYDTSEFNWPSKKVALLDRSPYLENRITVLDFLKNNEYSTVWENDFFKILVPSKANLPNSNATFYQGEVSK